MRCASQDGPVLHIDDSLIPRNSDRFFLVVERNEHSSTVGGSHCYFTVSKQLDRLLTRRPPHFYIGLDSVKASERAIKVQLSSLVDLVDWYTVCHQSDLQRESRV